MALSESTIGKILHTGGVAVACAILALLVAVDRFGPPSFASSDARAYITIADARMASIEKVVQDVAACLQRHIESAMHLGTAQRMTGIEADLSTVKQALARIESGISTTAQSLADLRSMLVDHEARIKAIERPR